VKVVLARVLTGLKRNPRMLLSEKRRKGKKA
jgi:hypothetical protein